jgi:hypothetical protein
MSQQAAAGQAARHGGGRRKAQYFSQGGGIEAAKPHKSSITEITGKTFNTKHNKFVAQFSKSKKRCKLPSTLISGRRISGGRNGEDGLEANNQASCTRGQECTR